MKPSNKLSITKKPATTVIYLKNSMTEKAINNLLSPSTSKTKTIELLVKTKIRDS